ncbi:ferrichrome siderophore peptide synthetase [Moesziomyces antarcticus]|uniref:Probable Ferrichrome siderophore peptide synthetase n=1 Tax=Pseudozyma antarctica TaxID=84753 RepID=A0A5C3FG09_PSEA2|nr:ferrichrome siderophore peptide synthetase [Moesziomyces antarcticus]GAK63175.1 ferrichrome siderophore peptide synthetase [Moesziomyces antarcticus]SPO43342.1 probable Ferrichrome siderophore peptide synthetase [Moesziomyces antarcticus]
MSHAPFPDVTGLRTSGPGFSRVGQHCKLLQVQHSLQLPPSSALAFAQHDLSLAILSAWCAILFHYGSHEASNIEVLHTPHQGSESILALDFGEQRELTDYTPAQLASTVDAARQRRTPTDSLEHGYAAFYEAADAHQPSTHYDQLELSTRPEISLALSFHLSQPGQLTLQLKAAPAVHSEQSALLQLRQVAALLESYCADSQQHALSVERFDWSLRAADNPNYVHLPDPEHLQGRHADRLETEFEYFASTTPDALALDFRFDLDDHRSTKWTYAEMNQRAEKVKQLLWSHGIGSASSDPTPDHIVALYLEKSPETYLSFIGVLKAGAAWCPIDTDWPASRRQALLAKSNAKVVLTHDDNISNQLQDDLQSDDVKSKGGMKAIRLDQLDKELQHIQAPAEPSDSRDIHQLAYMIWTSGTTGLPKGVGIQHEAIIQAMRALRLYIPYGKDKIGTDHIRYLQYSAYNFDLSIMDCFYTWGLGGTICSCPRGVLLQDLVEVGNSIQPTHTLLTPAVMAMTERHRVPSLKVVISGGEKLSQVVADEWSKDCCLLNLYGPAEATLIAMNRRVPLGDRVKAPNIGVALPTVSCHALDKHDRVVIKGAVGELVLGGPQLARGYVGDPVKTADKFFPHPQLGRVYRTGDLVRQLDNQEFEYLGRIDDQVKINGIRIELLEINAAIKNSHDHIKDSETMAFPKKDNESEQQIINFSALPGGTPGELLRTDDDAVSVARQLQINAKQNLPSYMVPNLFVILSHFPRTSSAKIDRVALKNVLASFDQLDWENKLANDGDADDQAQPSEAEACLRKWLAKLCNVDAAKIGRKTPFTSVGLDSIRAMSFSQRVSQEGFSVSVLDVARYPTLKALGEHLASSQSSSTERAERAAEFLARWDAAFRQPVVQWLRQKAESKCDAAEIQSVLPCTPLQEGMLAESQRDASSYRVQRQYQLPAGCELDRLRHALIRTVGNFDSMRTSFVDVGSLDVDTGSQQWPFQPHFLQVVWKHCTPVIEQFQIGEGDDIEQAILASAKSLRLDPFADAPPVAFMLVTQGSQSSLVFVAHHSTYDARSLGIFEDYVEALYEGRTPPPSQQFSAALSHILPIDESEARRHSDIWTQALASYPKGESVHFPILSLIKPPQGEAGEANLHESRYRQASVTWKDIEAVGRRLGVSARPLVQTAWAVVLSAFIESQHLVLGDSVSGRTASAELDQVYGPVLSTVPVPFVLRPEQTLESLVKDTHSFHASVMEAQHTDLGAIRKMLQVAPGEPLFHSVFVLEPAPSQENEANQAHFRLSKLADLAVATEHELGVEVLPAADGSIQLGLSWHKSLVSTAFGTLLLDQFDRSIAALCASSDTKIEAFLRDSSQIEEEHHRLYSITEESPSKTDRSAAFSGVANSLNREAIADKRCAVEVYHEVADSAAHRSVAASISYLELEQASQGVAGLLRHLPHNSVVGVCLERSLESYIAPLAILKAGHAYLPLDATLPVERKKELLQDSRAALLITSGDELVPETSVAVERLDAQSDRFQDAVHAVQGVDEVQAARVSPDDVAFIIYTSGSTGKPKGCLLTQANLAAAIDGFHTSYEREAPGSFEPPARFLARSAEAFDVHLLEIFLSLRVGATIVTGPRALVHDDIAKTMSTLEITHACVVPSLFFSRGERVKPADVPSLRALIIGGEALTQDLCQLWGSDGAERPVVLNAYGPSEATIGNSVARVGKRSRPNNIGKPFPGSQYLVLKQIAGRLVPTLRGEPGELYIGGEQVARGYLNRPDSDSFVEYNAQRVYRTGDMVRLHPSDEAEYLGRMDGSQVKVRGARLELGEVDAALSTCLSEELRQGGAAVTIHSDHPKIEGPARLVTFFAPQTARLKQDEVQDKSALLLQDGQAAARAAELRRRVRARLPQYMVPSIVLPLSLLPIASLSGKADRRLLKELYHSIDPSRWADAGASSNQPERELTDSEQAVAAIVKASIRLASDVKLTHDLDLIMAGLDSLSVVTLSSRLRRKGFQVSVASIMNDPTIEAIADQASKSDAASTRQDQEKWDRRVSDLTVKAKELPQFRKIAVEMALPCVPMQIALVSQAMASEGDTPPYITTITIDVASREYSLEQIRDAWLGTLARHAIYRTVFAEVEQNLVQVVLAPEAVQASWSVGEVAIPTGSELAQYHSETARDIVASIDEKPALRLKLWRGPNATPVLSLTCSHAIYDGDSIRMLLQEASDRLTGTPKDSQATSFAAATCVIVGDADDGAAKKFWSDTLSGFSLTPVPNLTGVRPETQASRSEELTIASLIPFSKLEAAARAGKVTVQSLLVAAYASLLGLYVGEDDVTLGLVLSGRSVPVDNIASIHGPCVTTVPLRLTDARAAKLDQLGTRAHQAINALLPYQHVSLPQLMRWLDLSRTPFEALFSYLGQSEAASQPPLFSEASTQMERDYPLAIEISATDDAIGLHLAFDASLIPAEQARLMLAQYEQLLHSLIDSEPKVEHLSILNKDCYVPADSSETIISRFAGHARSTPDAPAVVFASSMHDAPRTTSYAELDQLSSNIASHLVGKPGKFIGVHLHKEGPELYAAILAVWKAGKAYLPLDPTLPSERLAYMIESVDDCPVIASRTTSKGLADFSCEVMDLADLVATRCDEQLPSISLDDPCYLLFTSGSTGKPKAVQINHRAMAGALYSWERMLPFTRQSRFLQLASIGFDVSLIEVCMPLSLGFSIGTAPKQELLEDLTHAIQHLAITIADLPAALAGTVHPDDVQLEWLMSGGDVIDSRVVDEWSRAGRLLINAWGPTEATIGNTLGPVKPGATRNAIGRVYPASALYVLEEGSTRILPSGGIGELVVGGPQVADCYFGREELTAEKFIYLEDGSRVYRTGDLGRFLHDGTVECLGRIGSDRQVKVNGQRMELDEVCTVLASQPGVHDADVQYLKHPSMGSKQLVAFVAPTESRPANRDMSARDDEAAMQLCVQLEQEASKRLAAYMVPTHWIVTSKALPLTHNNKTDHKALAAFYEKIDAALLRSLGAKREGASSNHAWTETEKRLRKQIAEYCDVAEDEVTRNTSFHRLGIDSISAIRLVKQLRKLGYSFTVADVLGTPNIAALAEKQAQDSDVAVNGHAGREAGLKEWKQRVQETAAADGWKLSAGESIVSILPCTPLQTGMIAQSLASGGSLYFHHHAFELRGLSPEQVSAAWTQLVERLDILRTSFHAVEGEHAWAQAVHSRIEPRIVTHTGSMARRDLHTLDGQPSFEDEQAFRRPAHVLHVWPAQQDDPLGLVLSIHHALYDGTSLPQLLDDFECLLFGDEQRLSPRLPFHELAPSLLSRQEDVQHWSRALAGFQPCLLATHSKRGSAVLVERQLGVTSSELESRCRALGVSPQVLCNLAFAKLLALESGSRDVCFGQLFGLLDLVPEADTAVGPAFNTVATRIRFASLDEPVKTVAAALQTANDAGRAHRRAALRDVQAAVGRGQLFDALFDFQRAYDDAETKLQPVELEAEDEAAQYTLNVAFVQGPSRVSIVAKADSARFDRVALEEVVQRLEALLEHAATRADERVSALPDACALAFPQHLPADTNGTKAATANGISNGKHAELSEDGQKLAAIIAHVAGIEAHALHGETQLASLGLDSVSAIRIASQARRAGLRLGMGEIVAAPTINALVSRSAPRTDGHGANGAASRPHVSLALAERVAAELGVASSQIECVLPVLAGQKLWLAAWAHNSGADGFSFAYRLPGLDAERARTTWAHLRAKHPILRTALLVGDGSEAQVVLAAKALGDAQHFEAAHVGEEDVDAVVRKVVAQQATAGWKTLRVPPVKLTVVDDVLVFSLHHVVYDAFSIEALVRDFNALYHGRSLQGTASWIEAVQHIAREQEALVRSGDAQRFWTEALSGGESAVLSASAAEAGGEAFESLKGAIRVSGDVETRLRAARVSVPALVLAAWATELCARLELEPDAAPLFGLYQLGRSISFEGIDSVQGPLLNMLPVRLHGTTLVDRARSAVVQLRERARFEQTPLSDAHAWAGLPMHAYNTAVNVLLDSPGDGADEMQPVDIGVPTEYASVKKQSAGEEVGRPKVSVDAVLTQEGVDLAVKAARDAVEPKQLKGLLVSLARRIQQALDEL